MPAGSSRRLKIRHRDLDKSCVREMVALVSDAVTRDTRGFSATHIKSDNEFCKQWCKHRFGFRDKGCWIIGLITFSELLAPLSCLSNVYDNEL